MELKNKGKVYIFLKYFKYQYDNKKIKEKLKDLT